MCPDHVDPFSALLVTTALPALHEIVDQLEYKVVPCAYDYSLRRYEVSDSRTFRQKLWHVDDAIELAYSCDIDAYPLRKLLLYLHCCSKWYRRLLDQDLVEGVCVLRVEEVADLADDAHECAQVRLASHG